MFNLTGSEIMFLLIIGLVVLGPEKLPDAIRRMGRLYAELKRMSSGVQTDLRKVMDEPIKEMMKTTNSMKALFTDTASQFQGAAKDLVEPNFVGYTSPGMTQSTETTNEISAPMPVPTLPSDLSDQDKIDQLETVDSGDDEIAEAIARAAQIAVERAVIKLEAEVILVNPLDDVS